MLRWPRRFPPTTLASGAPPQAPLPPPSDWETRATPRLPSLSSDPWLSAPDQLNPPS
ncbi:hypothetical protein PtA15_12A138 [Puccinia triticina]|uniref:Uncharacterized protein n=1 Tax=Puccinia triticina TaxID=208348 RepID=A0ABY7D1L3_9BASI|nr:uncharacterized protein PtA15_12A138 [Puccinia triticina]WAQ90152.1 hypothetical protein PtA15_12A138 [Puccinia triticina]